MSKKFGLTDPNVDPYGYLGFVLNPDGSITRQVKFPTVPASSDPTTSPLPVLTKDITFNEGNKTWVRVFLPREVLDSANVTKLPLIVDFHGGGFVVGSPGSGLLIDFYSTVATEVPAIIVSVDYRLTPEHRLPAAYEDCMEALHWIKNTDEEWLIKYADFSRCFLMGHSAGGNIAYHVGLRASSCVDDLKPLRIKGLVLHQPFFGGTGRTPSEIRLANDKLLPLCVSDIMWELSLPIGVDRDHEYSNPTVGINIHQLDQIKQLGWKILITGFHGDPLIDRQVEFARMLEQKDLQIVSKFDEGNFHGYEILVPGKAKGFAIVIKENVICPSNGYGN